MDGVLQAFSDAMSGGGIWQLALVAAAFPLLVLVHELGHAAVGLARTEGLVLVRVGATPSRTRLRLGRLQLELNPLPARNAPAGLAFVHARFGAGTRVAIVVAGPLAEAAASALLVIAGAKLHLLSLTVLGVVGALDAVVNLVPFARHGHRSDGRHVLDALRAGRNPALADTHSRWRVFYSDDRSAIRTERRAKLLSGAPASLGHKSTDNPEALALWQLAFAGWCWRHAERSGDTNALRDAALDALHLQRIKGALEPDLTIRAARELATGGTDLSVACPGSTDRERASFLAGGLRVVVGDLRHAVLAEPKQKFAFEFGVALHDIERFHA